MNDMEHIFRNACEAINNLSKSIYEAISKDKNYQELRMLVSEEELNENISYFLQVPDEYIQEFLNMITSGFTMKESCELLKETYQF